MPPFKREFLNFDEFDPVLFSNDVEVTPRETFATPIDVVPVDTIAGKTTQTTNAETGGLPFKMNPLAIGLTIVGLLFMFGKFK